MQCSYCHLSSLEMYFIEHAVISVELLPHGSGKYYAGREGKNGLTPCLLVDEPDEENLSKRAFVKGR